jgi:hypothetical protein
MYFCAVHCLVLSNIREKKNTQGYTPYIIFIIKMKRDDTPSFFLHFNLLTRRSRALIVHIRQENPMRILFLPFGFHAAISFSERINTPNPFLVAVE